MANGIGGKQSLSFAAWTTPRALKTASQQQTRYQFVIAHRLEPLTPSPVLLHRQLATLRLSTRHSAAELLLQTPPLHLRTARGRSTRHHVGLLLHALAASGTRRQPAAVR